MITGLKRAALTLILLVGVLFVPVNGQTLSQQVLQLLIRANSWIGTNTFYDIRIPIAAVPSDTEARIYTDSGGNLYYDGGVIAGSGGVTTPHNFLSATHPDTVPDSPTRGAVVVGNASSVWARLAGTAGFLQFDGTDTVFSTSLAAGTAIPASQLTGSLPAIPGASLTTLNASSLSTGTVPLARISGLLNAQIDNAAAIAYSKLALTGGIVNADVSAIAGLAYSKLNLSNSIVAGDLTASSVTMAKIAQAGATSGQVVAWDGAAWVPTSLASGGSVTSAALSMPAIFSVAGSPITTSGTFAVTVASQTANLFWASPNGAPGAPTFRAMVNADLPTSGVAAGTYASVTVNTRGIITAATATVDLGTQGNGTVPRGKGGTGLTASVDDNTLVGNGTAWVATALPNCTTFWAYATSTNLFSCSSTWAAGTIVASAPLAVTGTWNNAGVNFNQFDINVTDTASTAASTIATYRVGGTAKQTFYKDGTVALGAIVFASLPAAPVNGMLVYCSDCTIATPCAGAGSGALAKRLNGAWVCD